MVTAELAFASLGAALACVLLAWALALVGLLLRCQGTAVEIARQEARGDRAAAARIMADRPAGARVAIRNDGQVVRVRVDLAARPWADWLPTIPLGASAAVQREPA
ncbi:MAG: TadE family type IV pilus minor pilin [Propionicimonas sp.]